MTSIFLRELMAPNIHMQTSTIHNRLRRLWCHNHLRHTATTRTSVRARCQNTGVANKTSYSSRLPSLEGLPHGLAASKYASAGNRARVTSMATMYSTTRPLMPAHQCCNRQPEHRCTEHTNTNNNAPREARTPDLEVNSLTL